MKTIGLMGIMGLTLLGCDDAERKRKSLEMDRKFEQMEAALGRCDRMLDERQKVLTNNREAQRILHHTELMQMKVEQLKEIQGRLGDADCGRDEKVELRGRFETIKREVVVLNMANAEARAAFEASRK